MRYNWDIGYYWEVLAIDETLNLERVDQGAVSIFYDHTEHRGIVEKARTESGELIANLRFSKTDEGRKTYGELRDETLRKFSIGYSTGNLTLVEQNGEGGLPVYRASKLTLYEVTVTPLAVDPRTGVRSAQNLSHPCIVVEETRQQQKEPAMPPEEIPSQPDPSALVQAETERMQYLYRMQAKHSLDGPFIEDLVKRKVSKAAAAEIILDQLDKRQQETPVPGTTRIEITKDNSEKIIENATNALMRRYVPQANIKPESGAPFQGYSIRGIMEELVENQGIRIRGLNPNEIYRRAQGMDDFKAIQSNFASRILQSSYESAIKTWEPFVRRVPITNFTENLRSRPSRAPMLQRVADDGTVAKGVLSADEVERYKLASYSTWIALTRQNIISDELGQFSEDVWQFGQQSGLLESRLIYAQLINNPIMSDGKALFSKEHKNIAAEKVPLDETGLSVARQTLRQQTDSQGNPINLEMAVIIVGSAQETAAEKLLYPALFETKASEVNIFKGRFKIAVDSIMDSNPGLWFGAVGKERYPIIELGYLEGQENGPYSMTDTTIEVDGTAFRYGIDRAAKVIDFRGVFASQVPANPIPDPGVAVRGGAAEAEEGAVRRGRGGNAGG